MRNGFTWIIPAIAVLGIAAGCGDDSAGPGDTTDYDGIDPIIYTQHVQPLFQANCAVTGCHTGSAPTAGLGLDSHADLKAGSQWGSVVVPHFPERSHLYLHLSGEVPPQMPFERDPLPDPAIEFVRRWIGEGAVFDDGTEMYTDVMSKAFVACQGEDLVAVLDMDAATVRKGRVIRLLDVRMPHSVWVDAATRRLYVSRFETASDNLRAYDADTYELLESTRAGTFPALLMTTPVGSQLWVTNFDAGSSPDNAVRVFDPANLAQAPTIFDFPGVGQPHGLAMTANGALVFITNIASSNVSVFETNVPAGPPTDLHRTIALPGGGGQLPQQCVLSDNENHLFVSALGSNKVHVLDVETVDQPGWAPSWVSVDVGQAPWHLALSPSGTELWVVNWTGESISIVNVANPDQPMVTQTLQPPHPRHPSRLALKRPMGIAFSPDGTLVYVTSTNDTNEGSGHHPPPGGQKHPGNVTIFDAATKEIVSVAEVPNFARFVSFLP